MLERRVPSKVNLGWESGIFDPFIHNFKFEYVTITICRVSTITNPQSPLYAKKMSHLLDCIITGWVGDYLKIKFNL